MQTETTKLFVNDSHTNNYNTTNVHHASSSPSNHVSKPSFLSTNKRPIICTTILLLLTFIAFYTRSIYAPNNFISNTIFTTNINTATTPTAPTAQTSSPHPNIIFILMDDMSYGDISLRGSEFSTPNLDTLYSDSIVINNHYIGLVCNPSRSQILSGRYAWNFGLSAQSAFGTNVLASLPTGLPILPQLLNQYTNYDSYLVGKWQLGYSTYKHTPLQRGFKEWYGWYGSTIDYETKEADGYIDWRDNDNVDYDTLDIFSTFVTGDKVNDIINRHATNTPHKPFYIYSAFQATHATLLSVDSENSNNCNVVEYDDDSDRRYVMCQNIMAVDQVIGEIMNNLKNNDIWDNSLIVFTSDNGGSYKAGGCNYPLRGGKDSFFEGGIKTLAFLSGGYVTNIKNSKKYAKSHSDDYNRFYDKNSYAAGQNIELHGEINIDVNNDENNNNNFDIDIRDGFMHGSDWTPTLLSIAGADINEISNDLQNNLYIPIAKEISLNKDGNEDNYEQYLMDTSFDGNDLSNWLLYGDKDSNTRDNVALSVNIQVNSDSDDDNNDYYINLDSTNTSLDNAIVFTSSITGHVYKLIYLEDNLNVNGKFNAETCIFTTKEDNLGDDTSSGISYATDDYTGQLSKTNKFLFDLTLEGNELTDLIETVSEDDSSKLTLEIDLDGIVSKYFDDEFRNGNGVNDVVEEDGVSITKEIKDYDDYDYDIIVLLWEEGIKLIETYSNNVMFNNDLKCQYIGLEDDADPSLIDNGDAWAPFYKWDDYTTQFNHQCGTDINVVLKKFYQSHYNDYMMSSN